MNELLMAKGKLAELEKEYRELERKAEVMFINIREALSPYTEFIDLDLELILIQLKELRAIQIKARDILQKIEKIKMTYNL